MKPDIDQIQEDAWDREMETDFSAGGRGAHLLNEIDKFHIVGRRFQATAPMSLVFGPHPPCTPESLIVAHASACSGDTLVAVPGVHVSAAIDTSVDAAR